MAQWARTASAMRSSGAPELVRKVRIWQLTPCGAPGAGIPTERMASTATTRRRLGHAATRPVASGSSATAATNTRRRYAAAVLVVPGVRARPQRSSDCKGVHAEPVPHRAVQSAPVALERDQVIGKRLADPLLPLNVGLCD